MALAISRQAAPGQSPNRVQPSHLKREETMPEQPEPVQLNQAVERVAKRFQIPSQERHIGLEWRTECEGQPGPITIWATEAGVDRVLNNLLSNAVKYTPEGGRVSVALRRTNGDAYVQVSDTGIGIPEEAMPHLFEEFYRAPNAKALEKEGTGLGLTITRDLIAHYDGRITVQSQAGQGTTFTAIWPTMRDA